MRSREGLKFTCLVLLLTLAGCDADRPKSDTQAATQERFAAMKTLDQQSCLCKLTGQKAPKIDAELQRLKRYLKADTAGESSAPLAGVYECYPELGKNACLPRYYLVAVKHEAFVCELEQAERLEAAWRSGFSLSDPRTQKAEAAMLGELSKLKLEVKNSLPPSVCA